MIVQRWQAPELPTVEQIFSLLESEGADPQIEIWLEQRDFKEHRHPWNEIIIVTRGELVINVSGNQVLLRQGDRIEIPANTRHSYKVLGDLGCEMVMGYKI